MTRNALTRKEPRRADLRTPERARDSVTFTPRCDILETEEELVVYADLPGVQPQDVDVRFENDELSISARCTPRQEKVHYLLQEYEVGDYYRAFTLSEAINADKITAELKNGVLVVHLPKSEAVKPKRITVQAQ